MSITPEERPFVRASVVINSLRDNGYKNTAYAIAELIDNSIQAEADHVQLVCFERPYFKNGRTRTEIEKIAIIDNGRGMDPLLLEAALAFGESQNRNNPYGMGKFGMGLPNSSISQCLRTDVWSWEENSLPYHTYLDIHAIKEGELESVPQPKLTPLDPCLDGLFSQGMPNSGTVILWSDLDRLHWKTSKSIYKHSESLIGRMYRRQIDRKQTRITFRVFEYDEENGHYKENLIDRKNFRPNDPMYLMNESTLPELPESVQGEAPFYLFDERQHIWRDNGKEHIVTIRSSAMKPEIMGAITKTTAERAGSTPWGKHMAKNIGVSIMRAERELDLLKDLVKTNQYEYLGRWYGIEIDFPPALDTIFGVTNNKQSAVNIRPITPELLMSMLDTSDFTDEELESLTESGSQVSDARLQQILEKLEEADPKAYFLYKVLDDVRKLARQVNKQNENTLQFDGKQSAGKGAKKLSKPEREASKISTDRVNTHGETKADKATDANALTDVLKGTGNYPNEADVKSRVNDIIENDIKVVFEEVEAPLHTFFEVSTIQGCSMILLNKKHPFHTKILEKITTEQADALKLCLAAWARMENEAPSNLQERYELARNKWGEVLYAFLTDNE